MTTGCRRAGRLLERRTAGIAEADALRLEEHLAGCERCRDEARILDAILRADADGQTARPPAAGARALRRAIDQAAPRPPRVARSGRSWRLGAGLALTGAAAAAVMALWPRDEAAEAPRGAALPPAGELRRRDAAVEAPAATLDRVETGMVTADGVSLASGEEVVPDRRLIVEREARLALAHAQVDAATGAALEWSASRRTLRLHTGTVRVAVDPAPRRLVRVVTERFAVEVLGTEFAVDPGGIEVASGKVRIVDPAGAVLVDSLGAGQAWRIDVEPALGPDARAPSESARDILARARSLIADGDAAGARRAARSALARRLAPSDAAEARTLLAECALLDGKRELAVRLYVEVAERHRSLPAGETALFLAGRVADDAGDRRAAAVLQRYLDTYPAGRFHVEATRRLANLGGR